MSERAVFRLRDMKDAIVQIEALLHGRTIDTLRSDRVARAAYERFLEILREASRGVPDAWKEEAPGAVPWRRIADIGNHIRHAYDRLDAEILWNVYQDHLAVLEQAVDAMIAQHASAS